VKDKMKSIVQNLVETHSCEIFFNSNENPESDPQTDNIKYPIGEFGLFNLHRHIKTECP
jgi:hypothetical protein